MSTGTSKLEMSLDDIIKSQKGKAAQPSRAVATSRGAPFNKRSNVGTFKGGKRFVGRKRIVGRVFKGRGLTRRVLSNAPNRIGNANQRRQENINQRRQWNLNQRRQIIGKRVNVNAFRNKNNQPLARTNMNNGSVLTATKRLVNKLVKKAIAQNVGTKARTVPNIRGKFRRVTANPILQRRSVLLNKLSTRSRVIGRRRVVSMQNSPASQLVRGRGPIRFIPVTAQGPIIQNAIAPRRPRNNIQYVQQQRPTTVLLQRRRNLAPRMQNKVMAIPQQQTTNSSIRAHINALRRASNIHQLESQFISQQQQRAPMILKQMRQPPRQRQQVFVVQQQRQQPRRRPQQPPTAKYIILQPQRRQQYVMKQQFVQRRPQPQRRQQIVVDPLYEPPNYLQRI